MFGVPSPFNHLTRHPRGEGVGGGGRAVLSSFILALRPTVLVLRNTGGKGGMRAGSDLYLLLSKHWEV